MMAQYLKDDHLAEMAASHNVARFASFGPGVRPALRHACISIDRDYSDLESSLRALFSVAPTVNVRVFAATPMKSAPFDYGIANVEKASALVRKHAADGLYTIVNETIDVNDGGVSGVSLGGIIEFSPKDTPRAVEKPGITTVSREIGLEIFNRVYGVEPDIPAQQDLRIEFSLHPHKVGLRQSHTILWERESIQRLSLPWYLRWPNNFSRFIGDKAFGLLVADVLGARVPKSTVIGRNLAPFQFGSTSGTSSIWLRTCPTEQAPGKYPTFDTWRDPFALLSTIDPDGVNIVSVLAQEGVAAQYSGATLPRLDGVDEVQGVAGSGERFMLGEQGPAQLPASVISDVRAAVEALRRALGPVRIEWAHDGTDVWILQLHTVDRVSSGSTIYPGDPEEWLRFDPADGLDKLRQVAMDAREDGRGVIVTRAIGTTSHVGDILRKAQVPAKIQPDVGVSTT